jgi:endogenous inhibitor of DNA gyrase (YacG/DUF329 family)
MKAPICAVCEKKPVDAAYRPFCSKRCADIDLGRWLSDRYAIPAVDNEAVEDDRPSTYDPDDQD